MPHANKSADTPAASTGRPRSPAAAGDSAHERSKVIEADMIRSNCTREEAEQRYAERHSRKARKRTPDPTGF